MEFVAVGIVFIAIGAAYIKWPAMFRRGIWLKTSIAIRMLSEDNYRSYIRGLGILFIVVGVVLIVLGAIGD